MKLKEAEFAELDRAIFVVETEIASMKALSELAQDQTTKMRAIAAVSESSRYTASELAVLRVIAEEVERLLRG